MLHVVVSDDAINGTKLNWSVQFSCVVHCEEALAAFVSITILASNSHVKVDLISINVSPLFLFGAIYHNSLVQLHVAQLTSR